VLGVFILFLVLWYIRLVLDGREGRGILDFRVGWVPGWLVSYLMLFCGVCGCGWSFWRIFAGLTSFILLVLVWLVLRGVRVACWLVGFV